MQREQICGEKTEFGLGPGESERLMRAPRRDDEEVVCKRPDDRCGLEICLRVLSMAYMVLKLMKLVGISKEVSINREEDRGPSACTPT